MPEVKSDEGWAFGQAASDIVTIGDPTLRNIAEHCTDLQALVPVVDTLVTRLRELKGAGLAAPQIAIQAPVAVVEVRKTDVFPDRPESPLYVFINPQIIERNEQTEEDWEGCFSVPGFMGRVSRPSRIKVNYLTLDGQERSEEFSGYLARVIQHEIDHLSGILFVDRLSSAKTLTTVANWVKFFHPTAAR